MRFFLLLTAVAIAPAALAASPRHKARHVAATPAAAPKPALPATPYDECEAAIAAAERNEKLPKQILPAIARVESGRPDPQSGGKARAWPWTIDVEGQGQSFTTKEEAIAAVQAAQARGVRSIDVGCMQVNLQQHATAFATLDDAFNPVVNAAYGARFLATLYRQTKNWPLAIAAYHSQTPELGIPYQQRVLAGLPGWAPLTLPGDAAAPFGAKNGRALASWPPRGTAFAAFAPQDYTFGAFAHSTDLALATLMSGRKRMTISPISRRTTQVAELPFQPRSNARSAR